VPNAADFDLAAGYLRQYETALRAGDALHLAIAANHGTLMLVTYDQGLFRAAKRLRLAAQLGQ
jgi:uncharacterized protein